MIVGQAFQREYQHRGVRREDLRKEVMAAEKEAETALGGTVERKGEFLDKQGDRVRFVWTLKRA